MVNFGRFKSFVHVVNVMLKVTTNMFYLNEFDNLAATLYFFPLPVSVCHCLIRFQVFQSKKQPYVPSLDSKLRCSSAMASHSQLYPTPTTDADSGHDSPDKTLDDEGNTDILLLLCYLCYSDVLYPTCCDFQTDLMVSLFLPLPTFSVEAFLL